MKIIAISDTHTYHKEVCIADGFDMIIHCGDFSNKKNIEKNKSETIDFLNWFSSLNVKHKIFIAGNHDSFIFSLHKRGKADKWLKSRYPNLIYLQDNFTIIDGIKIYGTPWTSKYGEHDFVADAESKLSKYIGIIPNDVDILISHSPAYGILDVTKNGYVGSKLLRDYVDADNKLKYHIHGHIHESYGIQQHQNGKISINASYLNGNFENSPVKIEI